MTAEATPFLPSPLDVVALGIDVTFAKQDVRDEWLAFALDPDVREITARLDEHDGRLLVTAMLVDLGSHPQGSRVMRERADRVRYGDLLDLVHDPRSMADALDEIAEIAQVLGAAR